VLRKIAACILAAACCAVAGCPAPVGILPESLPNAVEGVSYSQDLAVAAEGSFAWYPVGGALPQGLALSADTGRIAGTPLESGSFSFTVGARAAGLIPVAGERTYSLTVIPRLEVDRSLAPARVGEPYNQPLAASGGVPPYAFSVIGLPAGLSLDPAAGVISGVPLNDYDRLPIRIRVTDSGDPQQTASTDTRLTVRAAAVSITTASLPAAKVGQAYSVTLAATGGRRPLRWAVVAGVLAPPGPADELELNTGSGRISGTPATAGTRSFTVKVSDGDAPPTTDSRAFTIEVLP